ncbi:MAG: hypothetical protein JWO36_1743 [Myxococcales bacterium]|nr:hypothetical protein [Myxococcales bacterium]
MDGTRQGSTEPIFSTHSLQRSRMFAVPRGMSEPAPRTFSVSRTPATAAPSHDAALIAILDAPLRAGETAAAGFHRKEVELGNAFAKLTVLESRALNTRLAHPKPNDALAETFSRMTSERRARLLTFLADARRREAIARR